MKTQLILIGIGAALGFFLLTKQPVVPTETVQKQTAQGISGALRGV